MYLIQLFVWLMLCFVVLNWLWERKNLYVLSAKLPGPLSLPFIGSGYRLMCKREDILSRLLEIFADYTTKPIFRLWLGPKMLVVVSDADLIGKLVQSPSLQAKDDMMVEAMRPFLGEGLLTGSGAAWRARRRIIMPTIGRSSIQSFVPIISRETAKMADKMADRISGGQVDLEDYLHPCVVDIVCQTVLGGHMPTSRDDPQGKVFLRRLCGSYECIMENIAKPWRQTPLIAWLAGANTYMEEMATYFRAFIRESIIKNQDRLQLYDSKPSLDISSISSNGSTNSLPFEPLVMDILRADDTSMTMEELIDEIFTIFLASSDPTTNTSCFLLLMFAMHPELQDKAIREIYEVLGEKRRTITYEDCLKLNFIDMCIKETIRLFQTGPFSLRKSTGDIKIDDKTTLPEGLTVLLNYFSMHRSTTHWERPDEFYPDHFLPEAVKDRHPNAYMPFSGGARSCVGKLFAMIAIKIIIANVLWEYKLRVKTNKKVADLRLKCDISILSIDGYKVILENRSK